VYVVDIVSCEILLVVMFFSVVSEVLLSDTGTMKELYDVEKVTECCL
jgi:hypothetical protein